MNSVACDAIRSATNHPITAIVANSTIVTIATTPPMISNAPISASAEGLSRLTIAGAS